MGKQRDLLTEISEEYQDRLNYRVASDSWQFEGESITPADLSRILAGELNASNQQIINSMTRYSFAAYKTHKEAMRQWLGQVEKRPCTDKHLREWVAATQSINTSDIDHEAHVHAMKQWIWQVKRGIEGLPVKWHVAPVIWCKMNGTGKTYNLKALVAPLYQFTRELKVEELDEKFSGKMLARTLVVVLDEFEGCPPSLVPVIKSILTGKPFDKRGMMSESGFFAENRISCIATSNKEPPHGFYDETGARRFWSIHSREEKILPGSARERFFNGVDIEAIWNCVRVSDDAPTAVMDPSLSRYMDDLRDAKLRSKSSLETFMNECTVPSTGATSMKTLLEVYAKYCATSKLSQMRLSYAKAAEKLAQHGYECVWPQNRYQVLNVEIHDSWKV